MNLRPQYRKPSQVASVAEIVAISTAAKSAFPDARADCRPRPRSKASGAIGKCTGWDGDVALAYAEAKLTACSRYPGRIGGAVRRQANCACGAISLNFFLSVLSYRPFYF